MQDFASLKNTIIDSVHNGYGTELSDIIKTLEEQRAMDPQQLKDRFWDMFIVDIHPHLGPLCHHAEILRRRHHLRRRQGLTGKTILIRKVCCRGFPAVMLKCTKPAKLRGMRRAGQHTTISPCHSDGKPNGRGRFAARILCVINHPQPPPRAAEVCSGAIRAPPQPCRAWQCKPAPITRRTEPCRTAWKSFYAVLPFL